MTKMTDAKVLRAFPVSDDGISTRRLAEGAVDRVPTALFDGLKAEGYVTEAGAEELAHDDGDAGSDAGNTKPVIPADWRDLHFMKQIHLAKQIDPSVTKKDDAIAVLEAAEKAAAEAEQA